MAKFRFIFVINNYTEDECSSVPKYLALRAKLYAVQEEVGESGTPHLQGAMVLKTKTRITGLKKIRGFERAHFEADFKGTVDQAMGYCTDESKRAENGRVWTNWVRPKVQAVRPVKIINNLHDWQKDLINKISIEPDDRKVIWVCDAKGGSGKSQIAKYIIYHKNAIIVGGKTEDMFNGINNYHEEHKCYPDIVLVMLARGSSAVSYPAVEMIKDGLFYNSKYQGKQHIFNSPHIVIFSNDHPRYEKLTEDRWDEIILSEPEKINLESDMED